MSKTDKALIVLIRLFKIIISPRHLYKEVIVFSLLGLLLLGTYMVGRMHGNADDYDRGWNDSYDYYIEYFQCPI